MKMAVPSKPTFSTSKQIQCVSECTNKRSPKNLIFHKDKHQDEPNQTKQNKTEPKKREKSEEKSANANHND